jgi:ribonuclease HII
VASFNNEQIDEVNILKASFLSMHKAIDNLTIKPQHLIIDGNRFIPYPNLTHTCIIKGDAKFQSIAAASILAKTHRDELMLQYHEEFPNFAWNENKGYGTLKHRAAIEKYGITPYHRKTFKLLKEQLELF